MVPERVPCPPAELYIVGIKGAYEVKTNNVAVIPWTLSIAHDREVDYRAFCRSRHGTLITAPTLATPWTMYDYNTNSVIVSRRSQTLSIPAPKEGLRIHKNHEEPNPIKCWGSIFADSSPFCPAFEARPGLRPRLLRGGHDATSSGSNMFPVFDLFCIACFRQDLHMFFLFGRRKSLCT